MSINWNREVTGKDVKKFFNQEIKLGEINYSKCLQVSLLVFALGIVPAFTYGLVLGTLDEQRVALMGEVDSLKAQVIGSSKESQIIYDARASSELYASNTPVTISFGSATSTGVVKFDLIDGKSKLLQTLGTTTTRLGVNTFTFRIATSTLSSNDLFTVRVSLLNPQRVITTGKFSVSTPTNPVTVNSKMIIYSRFNNETEKVVSKPAFVANWHGSVQFSDVKPNDVGFAGGDYELRFKAPNGKPLAVGVYNDAREDSSEHPERAMIEYSEGSTITSEGTIGSFIVREIEYKDGKVVVAAIDFAIYGGGHGGGNTSRVHHGSIRFNSNVAIPSKSDANVFKIVKSSSAVVAGDATLGQSDLGVVRYTVDIKAGVTDLYVLNNIESNVDYPKVVKGVSVGGNGISFGSVKSAPFTGDTAQTFLIKKGQTRRFTVNLLVQPTTSGHHVTNLGSIAFNISPNATQMVTHSFDRLDSQTNSPAVFLNAR